MKSIKNSSNYGLVLLLIFMVSACGVYMNITTSADIDTDFTKYKTFAWLPDQTDTTNLPYNNEVIRNNIKNYFGQSFAARGYSFNLENPDLLLQIIISTKEKVVVTTYPVPNYNCRYYYGSSYYFPYPFNYYYVRHGSYCYPTNYVQQPIEYIESSITLNIIDRQQNKMVWSGTAKGNVYDPAYINRNIHPAVEAIMHQYPVKKIM